MLEEELLEGPPGTGTTDDGLNEMLKEVVPVLDFEGDGLGEALVEALVERVDVVEVGETVVECDVEDGVLPDADAPVNVDAVLIFADVDDEENDLAVELLLIEYAEIVELRFNDATLAWPTVIAGIPRSDEISTHWDDTSERYDGAVTSLIGR
jgi:hypothetical protein